MANEAMQRAFDEAKEQALQKIRRDIAALFSKKVKSVTFKFDAYSFVNKQEAGGPQELWAFIQKQQLLLDDYNLGTWELSKTQALTIARLVALWNADWEKPIANEMCEEDEDPNDYYNAYPIAFHPSKD